MISAGRLRKTSNRGGCARQWKANRIFVATDEGDGFAKPIGHRYLWPAVRRKKIFHKSV
jgi:hypothetical protein